MLGSDLMRAGDRAGHEMIGLPRSELDICDERGTFELLGRLEPDAVLNCAAWTDVDGAEADPQGARSVNRDGAGNVARAAAAAGARMLHVSTDYVFDGVAPCEGDVPRAYLERDPTGPRTVYGAGKLEGEELVMRASRRNTVARTAWLFGIGGRNFAETMLGLAAVRDEVRVVADQTGCPTWTGHLAPALLGLLSGTSPASSILPGPEPSAGTASPARSSARPSSTARCWRRARPRWAARRRARPGRPSSQNGRRSCLCRPGRTGWRGIWRPALE